ncbi:uncharacterized protein METZ01_LOCUS389080, partial [marine metagenome]
LNFVLIAHLKEETMSGICAEYIWIDGTKPTPQL